VTDGHHIPAFDQSKYPDHAIPDDKVSMLFLDDLCTKASYTVHLAAIDADGHVRGVKAMDIRSQRVDIRMFLVSNPGCNLYFSQNQSSGTVMPDEASVTMLRAVTIDIDPLPTTSEEAWHAERRRIKEIVHGAIHDPHLSPSIVIDTGNGEQLVWLLQTEIAGELNKDKLRQVMRALAWKYSGDKATTYKASGLFRIPGTCNFPSASKRQRGRHEAYGGIWHRNVATRHKLDEFATLALQGAPIDPDSQGDDYFTAERLGIALWQLIDANNELPVSLGYRIADKAQYDKAFKRLLDALQHPSDSKDRSGDDFRFVAVLHQEGLKPFEIAYCLAHYGASKAHPIGKKRWETYIVRTVLNVTSKSGGKREDFWVPPEPETEEAPSDPPPKDKTKKRKWALADEARDKPLTEAPPLIATLLPKRGMSMLYGGSNSGKSLVALLMCSCVAAQEPFGTCRVRSDGLAVFVAMEGGGGLHKRVKALARQNPDRSLERLVCLTERYSLFADPEKPGGAKDLFDELRDIKDTLKLPINLIVIDMLAIAATGANENSGEDMGLILDRLERIEAYFQCHVMLLHHTGKNVARGARGWSGIRGRMDAELEIIPPKDMGLKMGFLRISKQRDMDFNPTTQVGFRIVSILLGHDDEKQPITGATIELLESYGNKLTEAEQEMLEFIIEVGHPVTMSELVEITGKKMPYLTKLLNILIKKQMVFCDTGRPKRYSPMWPEDEDAEPIDPFS